VADAVAAAVDHVDGPFAVLNGDDIDDETNLAELFDRVPAVGYTRVETPEEYGVISTGSGFVTDTVERPDDPRLAFANTGAYAFPESARHLLGVPESTRGERGLTDVLRRLIGDDVVGVEFGGAPERPRGVVGERGAVVRRGPGGRYGDKHYFAIRNSGRGCRGCGFGRFAGRRR
jgi:dTDP-glucose pyrophosphorylase